MVLFLYGNSRGKKTQKTISHWQVVGRIQFLVNTEDPISLLAFSWGLFPALRSHIYSLVCGLILHLQNQQELVLMFQIPPPFHVSSIWCNTGPLRTHIYGAIWLIQDNLTISRFTSLATFAKSLLSMQGNVITGSRN